MTAISTTIALVALFSLCNCTHTKLARSNDHTTSDDQKHECPQGQLDQYFQDNSTLVDQSGQAAPSHLIQPDDGTTRSDDRFARLNLAVVEEKETGVPVDHDSLEHRYFDAIYTAKYFSFSDQLFFEYNSGDKQLDEYYLNVSGYPVADRDKCHREIQLIVDYLAEMTTEPAQNGGQSRQNRENRTHRTDVEMANYLNSFGSPTPGGVMLGNHVMVGASSQCLDSRLSQLDDRPIRMRYCMGNAKLDAWSQLSVPENLNPRLEPFIHIGLCLPESCDTRSANENADIKMAIGKLMLHNIADGFFNKRLHLHSVYCPPDERSPIRQLDWRAKLVLGAALAWFALLFVCTYKYEHHCRIKIQRLAVGKGAPPRDAEISPYYHLYRAFSVRRALADLFLLDAKSTVKAHKTLDDALDQQTNSRQAPNTRSTMLVNFDALAGIKSLLMFMVVAGHGFVFLLLGDETLLVLQLADQDPRFDLALASPFYIDMMFIISGSLMVYFALNALTKVKVEGRKQLRILSFWHSIGFCLKFTLTRYLRLMPLLVICHLFCRYLSKYTLNVPIWDFGTSSKAGELLRASIDTWPVTLLTLSNQLDNSLYFSHLPQSWSVLVDIQSTLILGPLILLTVRNHRLGYLVVGLLAVATVPMAYYKMFNYECITPDGITLLRSSLMFQLFYQASEIYVSIQYRFPQFILGIIIGHQLYLYETEPSCNGGGRLSRSRLLFADTIYRGSIIGLVIFGLAVTLFHIYMPWLNKNNIYVLTMDTAFWIHAHLHLAISIFCGIILLRLTTDKQGSLVARFLSYPFWQVVAKLGYSILLTHIIVYRLVANSQGAPPAPTWLNLINSIILVYTYTCLLSILVYSCFEFPISKFIGVFMRPDSLQSQSEILLQSRHHKKRQLDSTLTTRYHVEPDSHDRTKL